MDHQGSEPRELFPSAIAKRILTTETAINFLCSFLLNVLFAWGLNHGSAAVALSFWSAAADIFITCHCVCLITLFFSYFSCRRYRRLGVVFCPTRMKGYVAELPRNLLFLGLLLADGSFLLLLTVWGVFLLLTNISLLPLGFYLCIKGLWGGMLGAYTARTALQRRLLDMSVKL